MCPASGRAGIFRQEKIGRWQHNGERGTDQKAIICNYISNHLSKCKKSS